MVVGAISTFSVDNGSGYQRGATSMHLDLRGPTESLQVGDVFRVATDPTDYTVTGGGIAPGGSATEFDVEFTPALVAQNIANNATVTVQAQADRSFKCLAAIQRL